MFFYCERSEANALQSINPSWDIPFHQINKKNNCAILKKFHRFKKQKDHKNLFFFFEERIKAFLQLPLSIRL